MKKKLWVETVKLQQVLLVGLSNFFYLTYRLDLTLEKKVVFFLNTVVLSQISNFFCLLN